MGTVTSIFSPRFAVGQLVHHKMFDYRGVVADVDAGFAGSEAWYEAVAKSRPPKNRPWYRVLVHGASHMTYVAERNLERDACSEPVEHPMIGEYFSAFENGRYRRDADT